MLKYVTSVANGMSQNYPIKLQMKTSFMFVRINQHCTKSCCWYQFQLADLQRIMTWVPLVQYSVTTKIICMLSCWLQLLFKSLRICNTILYHRSLSTLFQLMACCLMAPKHHFNQCWFIIDNHLGHFQSNSFWYWQMKIHSQFVSLNWQWLVQELMC